ncbi:MAG: preprotein translocase subunit SecG [Synergistota bacterium]|nr:preprotein translocase subunit SecG [Synergistota bacterium]
MKTFLTVIHIVIAISVMVVILLQQRKQGGFTGVFGGGTQADMSGGQWQRFTALSKVTVVLGILFLVTSLILVLL